MKIRKWLKEHYWADHAIGIGALIAFAYGVTYFHPPPIAKVKHPSHECYQVISEDNLTCADYEKNPNKFEVVWVSEKIAPLVSE